MIALIDYDMGNLLSVAKALQCVGGEVKLVRSGQELRHFDRCVLPGVGNYGDGMARLKEQGLVEAVLDFAASGRPMIGVCMGMQMLMDCSEEAPGIPGLGLIKGKVTRFQSATAKVPHMGWNTVDVKPTNPLLSGIKSGTYFYFVHSYFARTENPDESWAECDYIERFSAVVGRDNIMGVQFHPEKSQQDGLQILRNFVEMDGL